MTTSIECSPFSGKAIDWPIWRETFLAIAHLKGYKKILLGDEEVDHGVADLSPDEERRKNEKRLEWNQQAYADLILSIHTEIPVGLVSGAKTDAFPNGDAKEAWNRLTHKFESQTASSRWLWKNQIQGLTFKYKKEDPEIFISNLEYLVDQYKKRLVENGRWKTLWNILFV